MKGIPEIRCDKCRSYHMIDSGYGHCRRFPPQNIFSLEKTFLLFWKPVWETEHTTVAWCDKACDEFQSKKENKCQK